MKTPLMFDWRVLLKIAGIVILLSSSSSLFAQADEREKIRQMESEKAALRQSQIRSQLDSAIMLTDAGKYAEADEKYRYVLKNLKSLPSDLTYHFGRNSYLLGQHSQAIDWLNKYIQLKGTGGQYSADAVEWMHKAEQALLKERQEKSVQATTILSRNYDIDCGPSGKVTCPVCKGQTVVVKKTYLGDTYKTCAYCKKLGYLSCEDYNKLLRGELKPAQ